MTSLIAVIARRTETQREHALDQQELVRVSFLASKAKKRTNKKKQILNLDV